MASVRAKNHIAALAAVAAVRAAFGNKLFPPETDTARLRRVRPLHIFLLRQQIS